MGIFEEHRKDARTKHMRNPRNPFSAPDSRLPLAALLVAGGLLMCAPQARAGHWEITPMPSSSWPNQQSYEAWLEEADRRMSGKMTKSWSQPESTYQPGTITDYPDSLVGKGPETQEMTDRAGLLLYNDADMTARQWDARAETKGGAATASIKGNCSVVLKFIPNNINTSGGYGPDPNDLPSGPIYLRVRARAEATARDYDGHTGPEGSRVYTPSLRAKGNESVILSLTIGGSSNGKTSTASPVDVPIPTQGGYTTASLNLDRVIKIDPGKQTELTIEFVSVDNTASVSGTRLETVEGPRGDRLRYLNRYVNTNFNATAAITPYYVEIKSDIENPKSYLKHQGALPPIYSRRDASGNPLYESQKVAGADTPTDTSDDVWKLECIRNADGSMTVESAAQWMPNKDDSAWLAPDSYPDNTDNWFGGTNFFARPQGFKSPSYQWSFSGGTIVGDSLQQNLSSDSPTLSLITSYQYDSLVSMGEQLQHPEGINLGGSRLQPGTKHSSVNLIVKEMDVASPSIVLNAGTYNVNWHATFEKQKDLPQIHFNAPTATLSVAVSRFGETAIPPIPPSTIRLSTGFGGAAGAIGALGGPEGAVAAASIAQALAGLLDLDVHVGGEPGHNWSNNKDDWVKVADDPNLVGNVSNPGWLQDRDSGFSHFDVVMKEVRRWDQLRWSCDEFDYHGFVGPDRVLFAEKNVAIEYQPFYTLRTGEPTSPPSTGGNP